MIIEDEERRFSLQEKRFVLFETKSENFFHRREVVEKDFEFLRKTAETLKHKVALVGSLKHYQGQEKGASDIALRPESGTYLGLVYHYDIHPVIKTLVNFYLNFKNLPFQLKMFSSEAEAMAALEPFLNIESGSILIVDDEEALAELLVEEAEEQGLKPSPCHSLQELEAAVSRETKPQFILLDRNLGQSSWEQSRSVIMTHSPLSRIFCMTGEGDFEDRSVEKIFQKPFELEEVMSEISSLR